MAASRNERNRTEVVEMAMEVQSIAVHLIDQDLDEERDYEHLASLAVGLSKVCQRCQERDAEENQDHSLILEYARRITAIADGLKVQVSAA